MPSSVRSALLVSIAVLGCACDPAPGPDCPDGAPSRPGVICVTTPDGGGDVGDLPDTGPRPEVGPTPCGSVGSVGGHCRGGASGTCGTGFMCMNEIRDRTTMAMLTARSAFGIEQGASLDPDTGFYEEVPTAAAVPADDVPLPIATGTLCTALCDASATTDTTCGMCATCSTDVGTTGLLLTWLFYAEADRPFDDATGWCRADCTFDPNAAGAGCPGATSPTAMDAHTCSPASNVCVEGCISDNECRFSFEETREGLFVSVIDDTSTAVCNPTTHRCDWTTTATETTGDPCETASDCTSDVGLCLNGGTCGEYGCGTAPDTMMGTFVCDGGRGVCLGNGGNNASICVAGCTTAADCNEGNACVPLGGGMTAGTFTGYCLGICDTDPTDPDGTGPMTVADDGLIVCGAGYQCDNGTVTADNLDPAGDCRVPCTTSADCTARTPDEGNYCDIVEDSSPAYGFCRWLDQVCNYQDLSADCYGGQVCDLLAFPENLGLCVAPCTDASGTNPCTGGDVCVTASGRNVCRQPCTTGGPACPTGEICQGTAPNQFCEQLTMM